MSSRLFLSPTLKKWIPRTRALRLSPPSPPALPRSKPTPRFETLTVKPGLDGATELKSLSIDNPSPPETDGKNGVGKTSPSTSTTYLGVKVPIKPPPPGDQDCCQSGCAICVYDLYLQEIEAYHSQLSTSLSSIKSKIKSENIKVEEKDWPKDLLGDYKSLFAEDEKGDALEKEKKKAEEELKRVKESLDPSLRAFLEMEARMKAKQRENQTKAS